VNLLLQTEDRTLISLSSSELVSLANALNEVCNGAHIGEREFESRLGTSRKELLALHSALLAKVDSPNQEYEVIAVHPEPASVMVRAISVWGDPVELSTAEAQRLIETLQNAIQAAS